MNIANQLPEAAMIFELLRTAKVINVFDVKNGYWNCPSRDIRDMVHACVTCNNCKIQRQVLYIEIEPIYPVSRQPSIWSIDPTFRKCY